MSDDLRSEVRDWLKTSWDEAITVREWWRRLADAGLAAPTWPAPFGRGMSNGDARVVTEELAKAGVIGAPLGGIGMRLAGPTILVHGTDDQKQRHLWPLLRGEESWCQLFSEPGAGSDLPSLSARAVRDGDSWFVTGQKVWNSAADVARRGMLLARTDPDAPKREGISFLLIDMDQPGIEVRPLRMMNGEAHFCEVFLTEARADAADVLQGVNQGWTVARTVLGLERSTATEIAARGLIVLASGEKAGHLDRLVGEVVASRGGNGTGYTGSALRARALIDLARDRSLTGDPHVRQDLARYWSLTEVHRWNQARAKAEAKAGRPAAAGVISKLVLGRICNMSRDLSFGMLGASALLDGADAPEGGRFQRIGLSSPGVTIGAGTDEIQRNTIGERTLGLPKEPMADIDPRATRTI